MPALTKTQEFLDTQTALARWYALERTQPAAIELRDDVRFFNKLAAEVRKITVTEEQASQTAEQAVRQFFSEGLAAGEVLDIFAVADKDHPEISVLSDEFSTQSPSHGSLDLVHFGGVREHSQCRFGDASSK